MLDSTVKLRERLVSTEKASYAWKSKKTDFFGVRCSEK